MKVTNLFFLIYLSVLFHCNQSERPLHIQPLAFIHVTIVDVEKGNLMQDQTVLIYEASMINFHTQGDENGRNPNFVSH